MIGGRNRPFVSVRWRRPGVAPGGAGRPIGRGTAAQRSRCRVPDLRESRTSQPDCGGDRFGDDLWGFGFVKLMLDKKVIRVGSDDVDNLAEFVRTKIAQGPRDN